jgi:hypothetical protein
VGNLHQGVPVFQAFVAALGWHLMGLFNENGTAISRDTFTHYTGRCRSLTIPKKIKTFGEALRWARQERGLTQKEVANKAEMIATFYCAIECDKRHTDRLNTLAKVLGVHGPDLEERVGLTKDLIQWLKTKPSVVRILWNMRRKG